MASNFEQRTNEFIELFYEGEGKAAPYLSTIWLLSRGKGYARSARSARSTHRYLQVPVADRVHKIVGASQVASPCVTCSCVTSYTFVRNQKIKKLKK